MLFTDTEAMNTVMTIWMDMLDELQRSPCISSLIQLWIAAEDINCARELLLNCIFQET